MGVNPRFGRLHRNMSVLVTAPNQLLSRIGRHAISLDRIRVLILSRYSHVLSVNFVRSVHGVVNLLPRTHRALVFSTAFSQPVRRLTDALLGGPMRVRITPHGAATRQIRRIIRPISHRHGQRLLSRVVNFRG